MPACETGLKPLTSQATGLGSCGLGLYELRFLTVLTPLFLTLVACSGT